MRIPIEWLAEYVDLKGISIEKVSEALNLSGTENEIISEMNDFPGIVVGEILEISKHPNADKLQVTKTKVGAKDIRQIVCGANNIEVGQKIPVALPGALIGDFEIKVTKLRGVKSEGMLCSEAELGISEDHAGIMILDPRSKVGVSLGEALSGGGEIIEAEITPNRSDCFSVIGIAREAAASLGQKVRNTKFEIPKETSKKHVSIEVKEKELCPRYVAKVIEGIKVGPSPKWIQERLSMSGIRPINNIVDITNYVMLEWGQPLHAFDEKKLRGGIVVRLAKPGENIKTLDGIDRKLITKDLVIADGSTGKPIAVAGVMGGANSEVDEKTKTIILEAAVFNGTSVRKTAQSIGIRTEASNRFEKGIPLSLPEIAIERAAQLIIETSGGKAGPKKDVLNKWVWIQHGGVSISRLKDFLGIDIDADMAIAILKSLGFEAEKFDFKKEARKHIGKPYVLGSSFKTHGDMAFDCSYLSDYLYSLIGKFIGYTSLAQFELGTEVDKEELLPGDLLFVNGLIRKSVTDHYYMPDGKGGYKKIEVRPEKKVGHNGIYIGNGRVIHARNFEFDLKKNKWVPSKKTGVVEEDVEVFTNNPEYLGARRYVNNFDDWIAVNVPWWRLDVKIEEDIMEELGRIYGLDKIPSRLPQGNLPPFEINQVIQLFSKIRNTMTASGFSEVINYSFMPGEDLKKVDGLKKSLRISNPISSQTEYLRTTLAASLLKNANINQANYEEFSVFEIGNTYLDAKTNTEIPVLGILCKDNGKKAKSFYRAKGALESVSEGLGLKLKFQKSEVSFLEKGQTAKIILDKEEIGYLGMTNEKTNHIFDLKTPVCVGELDLGKILSKERENILYKSVSHYPVSLRDISMVFNKKVTAETIVKSIPQADWLLELKISDIYEGKGLAVDEKSVTIRLKLGSSQKTLTEEEISKSVKQIINSLEKLGGVLRA